MKVNKINRLHVCNIVCNRKLQIHKPRLHVCKAFNKQLQTAIVNYKCYE